MYKMCMCVCVEKKELQNDMPQSLEHYIEQRISGTFSAHQRDKCVFFFFFQLLHLNNFRMYSVI